MQHLSRRLLKAAWKALPARTKPAQVLESINSGGVPIAPRELKRVVADRGDARPLKARRYGAGRDSGLPRKLVDAESARTLLPQVPGRIGAKMAVVPCDFGLVRTDPLDQLWHEVRHGRSPRKHHRYLYHAGFEAMSRRMPREVRIRMRHGSCAHPYSSACRGLARQICSLRRSARGSISLLEYPRWLCRVHPSAYANRPDMFPACADISRMASR